MNQCWKNLDIVVIYSEIVQKLFLTGYTSEKKQYFSKLSFNIRNLTGKIQVLPWAEEILASKKDIILVFETNINTIDLLLREI